ncbi:MAG: class I SAM-dependent methyltransferase [Verrucomicrobiia bacterium]
MVLREMMFGLHDEFEYYRCASCGCVQITNMLEDMGRYYPPQYYAYAEQQDQYLFPRLSHARVLARRCLTNLKLSRSSLIREFALHLGRGPTLPYWLQLFPKPVFTWKRVLEVGCGAGRHLLTLRDCGFNRLMGVDPFVPSSISYDGGVNVLRQTVGETEGKFDLVMLHHAYEHVVDPVVTLRKVRRLLARGGQVLIRIPLADSWAAGFYGANWVQFDAPRHLFLHTHRSMEIVAGLAGLTIIRVEYDSSEFQFVGSELYRRGQPLHCGDNSVSVEERIGCAPEDLRRFGERARELNRTKQGDQACFVLIASSEKC